MKSVATLIRFTWRYFSGCTALGVLLFCAAPLTLGLATQAFFDRVAGQRRAVPCGSRWPSSAPCWLARS